MPNNLKLTTMKKMMILLAVMVTIATRAAGMSYTEAKAEALFLTDKMAYELRLTDAQYEEVYEINFDYIATLSRHDVFGNAWSLRNVRLRHVLNSWQFDRFMEATYFYRPVSWTDRGWHFGIYTRYADRNHFYRPRPQAYIHYSTPSTRRPAPNTPPVHVGTTHRPGNGSVHAGTTPRPNTPQGHVTTTPRPNRHNSSTGSGTPAGHFGGRMH